MRNGKFLVFLCFIFMVTACATFKEGAPTGKEIACSDGNRPLMDCRMAFEHYQRTLKFDLGVIQSFGAGIGVGAQPMISLDSITGDLLAHQYQVCLEYNNCLISKNEYVAEQRYLRRAQMKIREMANTAKIGFEGTPQPIAAPKPEDQIPGPGPDVAMGDAKPSFSLGGTGNSILDELNGLDQKIQALTQKRGVQVSSGNIPTPAAADPKTLKKINIEYSLRARREKSVSTAGAPEYEPVRFHSGATLKTGDQFKINFMTDGDGYVYVINFDSQGKALIIFPHPEAGAGNQVNAGQTYEIPSSPANWYYLDDAKGQEILYIVASPFPIPNLDSLVSDLKQSKGGAQSSLKTARLRGSLDALTRGVGVVTDGKSGQEPKQSVMMTERIEFNHQ
jgi:hypothetical protein